MTGPTPPVVPYSLPASTLDQQLKAVEQLLQSPLIKRYLELMQVNAELKAQLMFHEKMAEMRNGNGESRPGPRVGGSERSPQDREFAERREREMLEARRHQERTFDEQTDAMRQRIGQLEAALKEAHVSHERAMQQFKAEMKAAYENEMKAAAIRREMDRKVDSKNDDKESSRDKDKAKEKEKEKEKSKGKDKDDD